MLDPMLATGGSAIAAIDILKKAGISNLRAFVGGVNLITWDKMKIWDPESTSGSGQYYPQARIINVGASVTF